MGAFSDRVFAVVKQIPRGKVATYGQIARIIGAPRSARYVGFALRANPNPGTDLSSIPCHRVVFKDGRMATGFAFGGPGIQQAMLQEEGLQFDDEGKVIMSEYLWDGHPSDPPQSSSNPSQSSSNPTQNPSSLADDSYLPTEPPADFDWEAELAEHPLHDCATCKRPHKDCHKLT